MYGPALGLQVEKSVYVQVNVLVVLQGVAGPLVTIGPVNVIAPPQLFVKVGVSGVVASESQLTVEPPFIITETKLILPQASVTFNLKAIFPITPGAV